MGSLGIFGVLREAIKTTNTNRKLASFILLIVFLSLSQLELGSNLALAPVLKDLSSEWSDSINYYGDFRDMGETRLTGSFKGVQNFRYNDGTTGIGEDALKDLRQVLLVKLLVLSLSFVVFLFFLVATISSSYEAYTAKVISLKDMFLKIKASWKRPIVTSFYMSLLSLGIICFCLILASIISLMTGPTTYLLYYLAVISLFFCYFHVAALWSVSLVVSVLEDDCSGLKAIHRAKVLMKGKRVQAYVMMLLLKALHVVVYLSSFAVTSNPGTWTQLAVYILFRTGPMCVLILLMFVAYTIFYHERIKSEQEKEIKGQVGLYVPIPGAEA